MECNVVTVYFDGDWKIIDGVWQFDGKLCKAVLINPNIELDELERMICGRFKVNTMAYDIRFTHSNPAPRLKPFDLSSTSDLKTFFSINNIPRIAWSLPLCVSLVKKLTENLDVSEASGNVPATTTIGRMPKPEENDLDGACVHDIDCDVEDLDRDDLNVPESLGDLSVPELRDDSVLPNEAMMAREYAAQSRATDGFIKKGQSFKSKEELKMAVSLHAIAERFQFRVKKSSKTLVLVVCIEEGCKWRVRASKLKNSSLFFISKYIEKHSCALETRLAHQRQASYQMIADKIKSRYEGINQMPSPRELIDIMRSEYNITASYWKCWKAHETAHNLIRGKPKDKYKETVNPVAQCESPIKRKRCGRPRKARMTSTGELKKNQCSNCNVLGHN